MLRITNYELRITNCGLMIFAFCLFTFAFGSSVHAQTEQPPQPSAPRVPNIPQPVEKTLANGLRVIVIERKNVPLVTAQLLVKSGGEVDPQGLAGAAEMTAELLTKGTKTRTATQIAEQVEFLGGSISSGAGWDASSVTISAMSDKFDKVLAIAADTVLNPTFNQAEIDRYRTQTLDELRVNLKQPSTLAGYAANNLIFGDFAYGHPLIGTPESLTKIKRADLLQIYQNLYQPDNAILVIVGDLTANNAFAAAQKHFGKWRGEVVSPVFALDEKKDGKSSDGLLKVDQITVIDLPASGQAAVFVIKVGVTRDDKNYNKLTVFNSILGGGYSARLNQEIRIKRGLSYGAGSSFSARRFGGLFTTRAQTKNESAAQVAEIMLGELNRISSETVDQTELTPRKAVLIGNFSRALETNGGLVNQIANLALYDLPLSQINSYIKDIEAIGSDDVQNQTKTFYRESPAQIVIVGDAKQFLPDLQKRFASTKIDVIPIAQLDLNTATLRKAAQ